MTGKGRKKKENGKEVKERGEKGRKGIVMKKRKGKHVTATEKSRRKMKGKKKRTRVERGAI